MNKINWSKSNRAVFLYVCGSLIPLIFFTVETTTWVYVLLVFLWGACGMGIGNAAIHKYDFDTRIKISEFLVAFWEMVDVSQSAMEWFSNFPFGNEQSEKMTADKIYDQICDAVAKAKKVAKKKVAHD